MAELLADIIFNAGKLKRFDILAYQIMLGHAHLLVWGQYEWATDRTLENARSVLGDKHSNASESTLSRVRPDKKTRSDHQYTISDLRQSIKGNFSRKIHMGNIWQKRFYTKIVNTRKYLETAVQYIQRNPFKAELPEKYYKTPCQYLN